MRHLQRVSPQPPNSDAKMETEEVRQKRREKIMQRQGLYASEEDSFEMQSQTAAAQQEPDSGPSALDKYKGLKSLELDQV